MKKFFKAIKANAQYAWMLLVLSLGLVATFVIRLFLRNDGPSTEGLLKGQAKGLENKAREETQQFQNLQRQIHSEESEERAKANETITVTLDSDSLVDILHSDRDGND